MCGRYTLSLPMDDLVEVFDVPPVTFYHEPRYNIAPTQLAPVVASDRQGVRMGLMRWGLVPSWAKDVSIGSRMINARAETLRSKPAFKEAVVARRCLVPADGFYEWVKEASGKVPYWIHDPDRAPLSLAGLWERWEGRSREGGGTGPGVMEPGRPEPVGRESGRSEPVYSFTIITVEPNDAVRPLHDRMPAIVAARERSTWLDRSVRTENALEILRPYEGELAAYPVSKLVNSPANDVAECIEPV